MVQRFSILLALCAGLGPAQEQKCRVEGQVVSLAGLPLKKAMVRLEAASQMRQSNFANYAVSSDDEGKFAFEEVTPGTYILSAEHPGYLRRYYGSKSTTAGATQIKLDAGQPINDLVLKLTPQGMIFGKVADEDGEPLSNFSVTAFRWIFSNGKKVLQATAGQSSQADGSFVMGNLPVGRYIVTAQSENNSYRFDQAGSRKPMEAYFKTYFPNAADVASAAPIDVAAGAQVRGIEIRVRRGRVFEISGRFQNALGGQVLNWANLELTPKDMIGLSNQRVGVTHGTAESFAFSNVPPGTYVIKTKATAAGGQDPRGLPRLTNLVAHFEVTLDDRNLENLLVPLLPEVEIRGTVKGSDLTKVSIQFHNSQGSPCGNADATPEGTFRMQAVLPDVVHVDVFGLMGNTYIQAIRFEGGDVKGKDLDLTSGRGGEMEIVLSPDGAEVTGVVRDADGKPVPGAAVQICETVDRVGKLALADQSGKYDFKGLAPGDYRIFAWEDDGDGVVTDPDFRKSFESKAASVTLAEKAHESIDAVLVAKDAMDVEAGKIR